MIPVVELFGNTIQGEGTLIGTPAVFVRTFGCNLNCRGFGMKPGELSNEVDDILKSKAFAKAKTIKDLPLAKTGCDSYPAIHPACLKFAKRYEVPELIEAIKTECKEQPRLIVFTGGEPLLLQDQIREVMLGLYEWGCKEFMFETNGTVPLKGTNKMPDDMKIWFSVSPKLSNSGNTWASAFNAKAVESYYQCSPESTYLKFVVDANTDFTEVVEWVAMYEAQCSAKLPIFLMPEGGTLDERSRQNALFVANECWKRNWRFSPREHLTVFGNAWSK